MKITFIVFEDVDEVPEVVAQALLRATSRPGVTVTPGDESVTQVPQVEDKDEKRKSLQRKRQAAYRERQKQRHGQRHESATPVLYTRSSSSNKDQSKEEENTARASHASPASRKEVLDLLRESFHKQDWPLSTASAYHDAAVDWLWSLGADRVDREVYSEKMFGRSGRIDVVARINGVVVAVELDNRTPRAGSLDKLAHYDADLRIVMLRVPGYRRSLDGLGVDAVLCPDGEDRDFDLFWDLYDRKDGRSAAIAAWARLTRGEKETILTHVKHFVSATPNRQYRPHASSYLNSKRFNDEELPDGRRLERDDEGRVVRALPRESHDGGVLDVPAAGFGAPRGPGAHGAHGPRQGRRSAREVGELSLPEYLGLEGVEGTFDPGPPGSLGLLGGDRGGDQDDGFRFVAPAIEGSDSDEREGDRGGAMDPWGD